jgi:hypothetical protein
MQFLHNDRSAVICSFGVRDLEGKLSANSRVSKTVTSDANHVKLEILAMVTMRCTVFCDVISFSPVQFRLSFEGTQMQLAIFFSLFG